MKNQRMLVSRNKREGAYAGKTFQYDPVARHRRRGPDIAPLTLQSYIPQAESSAEAELLFDWVVF